MRKVGEPVVLQVLLYFYYSLILIQALLQFNEATEASQLHHQSPSNHIHCYIEIDCVQIMAEDIAKDE